MLLKLHIHSANVRKVDFQIRVSCEIESNFGTWSKLQDFCGKTCLVFCNFCFLLTSEFVHFKLTSDLF